MFQRLFNLGTKSGMPPYMAIVALLQVGISFIPKSVFAYFDLESFRHTWQLPIFIQHYVNSSNDNPAMLAFWLLSPLTLLINTALCLLHLNCKAGFEAYRTRRITRLAALGNRTDYSLIISGISVVAVYIWAVAIQLDEPKVFGNAIPAKSIFMMILVHGGSIGLLLPVAIAIVVTELRANLAE